ncbi:MAG TPA: M12 family metallo-peptidase [Thermoanaerobaculia bacterium]|nr:M12 family metallo-peptidase [Thermoanaerobaculia bacterium]
MNPRFLLLVSLLAVCPVMHAAPRSSPDGLWTDVREDAIAAPGGGQRLIVPKVYRTVTLDVDAFRALVAGPEMTLPMPDGSFAAFAIEESPIMEPELAAQLPDVKTYRGTGIDDPAAIARFDFTPTGFHGLILAPAGAVYIDPFQSGDTAHYISYWRRDYERAAAIEPFHCDFGGSERPNRVAAVKTHAAALAANGATLRTYRLALACTGEYAAFYGGTVSGAQAGMVTTINRVNAIYEKELSVRMTMVSNSSICFTNATSDPYSNTDSDLSANQSTIDANIGSANYDIGHLFGTGGGGVASLGVVCFGGAKARGLTGSSQPVGDAFDVDYVAHEMGHQFGADHTFNGTTSNCGFGNRWGPDAYEPGSGSTIMAYAGICGAEDLQPHSDPYFHTKSFDEIVSFITGSATCAVQTSTGNAAPAVSGVPSINIPMQTPFYLTASGSDPNGDALTWCWEEFDLGTAGPPNTDGGGRPIFRSFNPVTSPVRTFPRLADILGNTATFGESLPNSTRTMNFRVTARDGKGGVSYGAQVAFVTSLAGPFTVTSPNTAVSWSGNSTQNVTWNVAGTDAAPVNCANVKVHLSTDGGNTFPTMLLFNTPNDGTQTITVPNITTSTARIKVECNAQPFFDVSNANFSITSSLALTATATTPTNVLVTWTIVPGSARYDVYRRGSVGDFAYVGQTTTTSFNDITAAPGTAYLYAVRSIDTSNFASPLSSPDLATTVVFTDPTLVPLSTAVKAAHVNELRTAVNAVRTLAGQPAFPFTDPGLAAGATVSRLHIADLRTALDAARSTLGLSAVSYDDPTVTAGATVVRAVHVDDLRNGVR